MCLASSVTSSQHSRTKNLWRHFLNSFRNMNNREYRSTQYFLVVKNVNSCAARSLTKSHTQNGNRQRLEAIKSIILHITSFHEHCWSDHTSSVGKLEATDWISLPVHRIAQISAINFCFASKTQAQRVIMPKIQVIKVLKRACVIIPLGGIHGNSRNTMLWECLTARMALSHANAKGKGIDSKGWAFRML